MADPDLEIRGAVIQTLGGGGGLPKNFFSALRASVWSRNKGVPGPPGPSLGSATACWGRKYRSLYRALRYLGVHYIEVPLYLNF